MSALSTVDPPDKAILTETNICLCVPFCGKWSLIGPVDGMATTENLKQKQNEMGGGGGNLARHYIQPGVIGHPGVTKPYGSIFENKEKCNKNGFYPSLYHRA